MTLTPHTKPPDWDRERLALPDPASNARPPLANDLFESRDFFERLLDRFPAADPLVPRLRHLDGVSIEEELDRIQQETGRDPERFRQLAAVRFYIQAAIAASESQWWEWHRGRTNYHTLLDDIRSFGHSEVALVTFNYDRLLDFAATRVSRRSITDIDDCLRLDPFSLFKLHGSTDWGRGVINHNTAHVNQEEHIIAALIKYAKDLTPTDTYVRVDSSAPIVRHVGREMVLIPAIAVPLRSKSAFECPPSHVDLIKDKLRRVDKILIVGWRGLDQHFVRIMAERLPRRGVAIQVVCGNESEDVAETLATGGVSGRLEPLDHTFSSYVLSRAGDAFLAP